MACERIRLPDGATAIICRGRTPAAKCQIGFRRCRRSHVALCDYQLEGYRDGRTCDVRLCEQHRTRVGPQTDLCPYHARARAADRR